MIKRLHAMWKDEDGITALETAIILIAFVVVAAVFAFTVLSAGTFLSEEAAYAGLEEVRGSVERKGDVVAYESTTVSDTVKMVTFKVALVAGGEPVDLTDTDNITNSKPVVHMSYRDENQEIDLNDVAAWTVDWPVYQGDSADNILEANELALVKVCLDSSATDCTGNAGLSTHTLGTSQIFNIEVIPPSGAVLNIERTTPAKIDSVEVLN
jgi:flagellin FlaB